MSQGFRGPRGEDVQILGLPYRPVQTDWGYCISVHRPVGREPRGFDIDRQAVSHGGTHSASLRSALLPSPASSLSRELVSGRHLPLPEAVGWPRPPPLPACPLQLCRCPTCFYLCAGLLCTSDRTCLFYYYFCFFARIISLIIPPIPRSMSPIICPS